MFPWRQQLPSSHMQKESIKGRRDQSGHVLWMYHRLKGLVRFKEERCAASRRAAAMHLPLRNTTHASQAAEVSKTWPSFELESDQITPRGRFQSKLFQSYETVWIHNFLVCSSSVQFYKRCKWICLYHVDSSNITGLYIRYIFCQQPRPASSYDDKLLLYEDFFFQVPQHLESLDSSSFQ